MSEKGCWKPRSLQEETERIADIYHRRDTLIVMTRSHVFESLPPYTQFTKYELKAPDDYSPKVSLFRTIWLLHSGELFGLPGQLVVDLLAVVISILCITGLIYTFMPKAIRRRKRLQKPVKRQTKVLKFSIQWHYKLGAWLIVLTTLLAVTGMCLRPPLMIPCVMTNVKPVPGSTMDSDNPWHDKLRSIRWDDHLQTWLLSTSAGFYQMKHFAQVPVRLQSAPPISPMGINAFHPNEAGEWLVGSFSGMFRWNPATGTVIDYYTGKPAVRSWGRPVAAHAVAGFSFDLAQSDEVVFDYNDGMRTRTEIAHWVEMPPEIQNQPMSLWNFALELHVGRCYSPFLGPISDLFVFLAGLTLTLILISGYIVHRKHQPQKKKK